MPHRLALALTCMFLAAPVSAQMVAEVQFQKGNYGTTVNGTIKGNEYFDYTLGAQAGQKMFVELNVDATNGNGTAYFNILPPGSEGEAIYNGSMDGTSTTIELPEDGTYTVRVYLMGNDRDTDKTVGYNVDLSIQ
ncbi:hypothetical protein CLV78_10174 [Aliiruegeria haliotis]|uniref:Inhibitor of g-type lysozyme n=1 Tax=Aliiruegeria haliotis TaxID=1280846 RepID=A0A2T0RXT3_9RHOB|nr:hypothetical protein [Aliiruegeria haliotis]PRY25981.1 hypothetical protein CLV78_10174 [Aliiruegeria haliotis]